MKIVGYLGVSLIDFPGRISTIIFTPGCNFKCPYCQNPDLVNVPKETEYATKEQIDEMLIPRIGFIDGVSITGGEPTLQPGLAEFMADLKSKGLQTKLDTNGYRPDVLESLLKQELLDFVAMDFKTSLERYSEAAGVPVDLSRIEKSVDIIIESGVEHEFRTTMAPNLVNQDDVEKIARRIKGADCYYLHQFENKITLDPSLQDIRAYTPNILKDMAKAAEKYLPKVKIRGI